ncbi:hypothetical protein [Actinomadura rubrisoli]|uniref:hypothetical protein n=1 Tax=Actinomadura rubrisoli TaxID=2530368 RepID=UPI0014043D72|nr:hypothetical protein [Actinomadura rubrisoli]
MTTSSIQAVVSGAHCVGAEITVTGIFNGPQKHTGPDWVWHSGYLMDRGDAVRVAIYPRDHPDLAVLLAPYTDNGADRQPTLSICGRVDYLGGTVPGLVADRILRRSPNTIRGWRLDTSPAVGGAP